MQKRLTPRDVVKHHAAPLIAACAFLGVFMLGVPIVYSMSVSPRTELIVFASLFAACHLANWPMMQLRWRLWFRNRLTPFAAFCTTALLAGSFGIPFILLVDMIR